MKLDKDLYKILGVSKDATADQIRKSYRRLAKKHHPDSNQGNKDAEERFKDISHAYEILKDSKKREQYDAMRDAASRGFDPRGFGGAEDFFRHASSGRGSAGAGRQHSSFEDLGIGDLFGDIFDLGARSRRARYGPQKGDDVRADVRVPFEVAAKGGQVSIKIPREETCSQCGGVGSAAGSQPKSCPECRGTGTISSAKGGSFAFSQPCPRCYGRGQIVTNPCPDCSGRGTRNVQSSLKLNIPPGAADGSKLRLPKLGQPGVAGGPPGDLILTILVGAHPQFAREGHNLLCDVRVDIVKGALGGTVSVPSLEGEARLKIPAGVRSGQKMRLKGRGLPRQDGGKGDQIVTIYIDAPKSVSEQQRKLLEEFSRLS